VYWATAIRAAGATVIYAIIHSLLASLPVKQRVRQAVGPRASDGLYRFGFNGFSVVSLAAMMRWLWTLPDRRLYKLRGLPAVLLYGAQVVTAIALIQTNRQNGLGHVTGIRHAWSFVRRRPIGPTPVVQHPLPDGECMSGWTGTFRLSSHPNNYLVLFLYWLSPVMTVKWAAIGAVTAVYMVVGSLHEDQRLLAAYGERYRCYRARVPHLAFHSLDHWRAALQPGTRDD
jgi:hypothetical protein